jgi:hypothetical protein
MKGTLHCFAGLLLVVLQMNHSTCQKTKPDSHPLLPLAAGNEWIYVDSTFEKGKLVSVKNDTDRITGTSEFQGKKSWIFSDGRELMLRGDTLFQLVRQRSSVKFPTPLFIATETETKFNYAFGGDVMKQQTVKRLHACPKNPWNTSACYSISDDCGNQIIFGAGVGVMRQVTFDCFSGKENYSVRTLREVNLKK